MKYCILLFLVIVASATEVQKCPLIDMAFTNFDCRSEAEATNTRCTCKDQSTCQMTTPEGEHVFTCQSPVVENLLERNSEQFDQGPVRK